VQRKIPEVWLNSSSTMTVLQLTQDCANEFMGKESVVGLGHSPYIPDLAANDFWFFLKLILS